MSEFSTTWNRQPIPDDHEFALDRLSSLFFDSRNQQARERSEQLFAVTTALSSATTIKEVADVIIQAAFSIFQAKVGIVALLTADQQFLISERIVGMPEDEAEAWRSIPIEADLPITDAVRHRQMVLLLTREDHVAAYPNRNTDTRLNSSGALLAIPLIVRDHCVGGLGLICPPDRCSDPDQQTFLRTLAGQCALAIERAKLFDSERNARRKAQAEINERRLTELTLRESEIRFRALADNIAQLAWMADITGSLFWWNRRWFEYTGTTPEEMVDFDYSRIHHPDYTERVTTKFLECIRTGQQWDDTFPMRGKDGVYRWFLSRAFPILNEDGNVILWCGTNTDVTEQREAEIKLAAAYRHEVLLNTIGKAIRGTSDPQIIQSAAVNALGKSLNVDRAYFSFIDKAKDTFVIGHNFVRSGIKSRAGRYRISDYQLDPNDFFPDGKTLVLHDLFSWKWEPSVSEMIRMSEITSAIKVPFYENDKLVAMLVVSMANGTRQWTSDEIAMVEAVALQMRAALAAAIIQEQEHRVAQHLQDALQPALPENITGLNVGAYTQPALDEAAIGGDFLDIFPLDKNLYAIVIGDVSGKGLAAAQQLALVRNSLRTTLYLFGGPRNSVESLNRMLTGHRLLNGFVTAFVAVYDSKFGSISYCSCGHEPALIRRADSGIVEELALSGPPLGIDVDAEYPQESVMLGKGDILLLYTDGISESGKDHSEMLGTDGLKSLFELYPAGLSVQAQAEHLVETIRKSANGAFRDDVAVLLAQRL